MALAANELMPKWRNALTWAAVGFVFLGLVMLGAVALLQDGGVSAVIESGKIAVMAAALIFATMLVGFSKRNSPLGPRTLRNFLLSNAVALAIFALAAWGYGALAGTVSPGAMGVSAKVALVVGTALFGLGVLCVAVVTAAHSRGGFLDPEQAEDTREQGRATIYSAIWMAATGLTLALLSLAGPGGALSPTIALAGSAVLLGIATVATFAVWPLLDELSQAMSREAGNAAFYLIFAIGGGWAILAHLGLVRVPTPLDWLTMLVVTSFAASIIAIGRRGLLKPRRTVS